MTAPTETVVLVHGMGRTRASLLLLAMRLRGAGYRVANFPYNQVTDSLAEITEQLVDFVRAEVGDGRYHLVGHSLGNVLIRDGFRVGWPPGLRRIVMLAPPNRPAQLAGKLRGRAPYRWLTGDAGQRLADPDFYAALPVPDVEFGVIAGDRGRGLLVDGPSDGIVAVEATKLDGMTDFAVVHHGHTFLMNAGDTFGLCLAFLRTGRFPD